MRPARFSIHIRYLPAAPRMSARSTASSTSRPRAATSRQAGTSPTGSAIMTNMRKRLEIPAATAEPDWVHWRPTQEEPMPALSLDHWNIYCKDLDATVRFYERYVGLRNGDRPPFMF